MTPASHVVSAGNTTIGPVLHAVRGKATVWTCSDCGLVFSGDRHYILAEFAAHVFKTRKRTARRAVPGTPKARK